MRARAPVLPTGMSDTDRSDVVHVPEQSRFELTADGRTAVLVYERGERDVALLHTVVPPELEGQGVGGRLAETAVRWVTGQHLQVVAVCSFVQGWLARHPDALEQPT